ncbi:MAG: hypothetical protein R3247_07345 [Rhodothermales bacterium]|nr:hypothetical protein [Rhodothermales bacterium]
MERIVVIGSSCAGKTTFARRLARRIGVPHVELDALYWLPGWEGRPREAFRALVAEATAGERWIVDGNYSKARDVVWPRATTAIWLDFAFPRVMARALLRTTRRVVRREVVHGGNRETFRNAFLHWDGIPLWVLRTFRRRRREYPALLSSAAYAHLHVVVLRRPAEAEQFLAQIEAEAGEGAHPTLLAGSPLPPP